MRIQLTDCYCWQRDAGFATFIKETVPIEFPIMTAGTGRQCRQVMNGPYRITVCLEGPDTAEGAAKLTIANKTFPMAAMTEASHGKQFIFIDGVEIMGPTPSGQIGVLGKAEGCFSIEW